jgi:hypothetical protein
LFVCERDERMLQVDREGEIEKSERLSEAKDTGCDEKEETGRERGREMNEPSHQRLGSYDVGRLSAQHNLALARILPFWRMIYFTFDTAVRYRNDLNGY